MEKLTNWNTKSWAKKQRMNSSTPLNNSTTPKDQNLINVSPVSPIPQVRGREEGDTDRSNSGLSQKTTPEPGSPTNISIELRGSRLGPITNCRYYSSEEFSIDVLCLESVLVEKGMPDVVSDP